MEERKSIKFQVTKEAAENLKQYGLWNPACYEIIDEYGNVDKNEALKGQN